MEEKKRIKLCDLLPVIEEKLAAGGTVKIPVTGTSMLPLLVEGRDTVTLTKAEFPLKKYDLPLFRRRNGVFVLHRVIAVKEKEYIMCGDNQWVKETGVTDDMVIGVVCAITRKGKTFSVKSTKYKLYIRFWNFLMPVRKYIVKLKSKMTADNVF